MFVSLNVADHPAAALDTWTLDSGPIDVQRYVGETVANGMIGIVSGPAPFDITRVLLNGAFDITEPGGVSVLFPVFNPLALHLAIDGQVVDKPEQVQNFHQRLDMRHAVLTSFFDYQGKATVTYTLRALRQLPYSGLLEVTVQAKRRIEIESLSGIEAPGALINIQQFGGKLDPNMVVAMGQSPTGAVTVSAANRVILDRSIGGSSCAAMTSCANEPKDASGLTPLREAARVRMVLKETLEPGQSYHFAVVGSVLTSANVDDPLNNVQRITRFAELKSSQKLIDEHDKGWSQLWSSDIQIQGDDASQRDVHNMLYHLYSYGREGTGYSIPPMGLTGLGYSGHIFWDAEVWMFPVLLALQPKIAASMLDYRYNRLDAAKHNALQYGYRGALFPWESAASGSEETPMCCMPFEQHITGDVALAAWNYYRVTRDATWLRQKGYPILQATADFWASRVERNGPGHYDITHVVAADEYASDVDNDAFTNAVARANLEFATAAARVLKVSANPDWMRVRNNIPILHFPNGIVREHATYHGEEVKQADVALLAYPLREVTSEEAIRNNLAYYKPRIPGGPAMTKSIWALLYERLGSPEDAYAMFKEGYEPNLQPPFGSFGEEAGHGEVYFATGAGGILQTMIYGFGGLEITDPGFVQRPTKLPAVWKSITLTGIGPHNQRYGVKTAR